MCFPRFRVAVLSFCSFFGVSIASAQQATVNHAVSLRGDPSTKNAPIGHLLKNSTVTLLAAKPQGGFYHIQTAEGQEGWVAAKYLTKQTETQPASGNAGTSTPSGAAATGCDSSLWDHVYNKSRLTVISPCATVTGTVHIVRPEPDGDVHIQLTLDPPFSSMLNATNRSKQNGALVIEPMCDHTPTQPDAIFKQKTAYEIIAGDWSSDVCSSDLQKFPALTEGAHVTVTGSYVTDHDPGHGWREIHPITSVTALPASSQ